MTEASTIEPEVETREPGIYDIPEPLYHTGPGISQSSLAYMGQSAAHYKHNKQNPMESTAAMCFGSLYHPVVLEPKNLKDKVAYGPNCERRSNVDKAEWAKFYAANMDKVILDANGYILARDKYGAIKKDSHLCMDLALTMREVLMQHQVAKQALEVEGMSEKSLYSIDEETGILKRCRIDRIPSAGNALIDVKTSADASPEGFMKSVFNFNYHVQGAYYLDIANELGLERTEFVFIVQEKVPPFAVAVYKLDEYALALGRQTYRRWLNQLDECIQNDTWDGYPEEVMEISVPPWIKG